MHFGEYELSPGLIGLSLLPSPHPEAFQRLSVRPSIPRYRDFSLGKGRSPGFASAPADHHAPSSDSLSLRLRASSRLAGQRRQLVGSLCKRHAVTPQGGSDRLWAHGFRDFFTPLRAVLFTFPSRYWFAIGLPRVFSLGGWSRRIRAGFHVPRATQGSATVQPASRTGLSPPAGPFSNGFRPPAFFRQRGPTTPARP